MKRAARLLCSFGLLCLLLAYSVACTNKAETDFPNTSELPFGHEHHGQAGDVRHTVNGFIFSQQNDMVHLVEKYEVWECTLCEIQYRIENEAPTEEKHDFDGTVCTRCGYSNEK